MDLIYVHVDGREVGRIRLIGDGCQVDVTWRKECHSGQMLLRDPETGCTTFCSLPAAKKALARHIEGVCKIQRKLEELEKHGTG